MIVCTPGTYRRAAQAKGTGPVETKAPALEAYWRDLYPKYEYAAHVRLLVRELEALAPGEALIINMPPRHSKTETVLAFTEHYMGRHPDHEVMYVSYSANLAYEKSRKIRNRIRDAHGVFARSFPGVHLATDAKKVSEWRFADGGGLIAAGVGGSLTGKGASLAIIDDPLKGRKQAESSTIRNAIVEFFKSDLYTRLEPASRLIIIQTRWHQEDLTGWILKHKGDEDFGDMRWKVLSLPAIAEPTDESPDPLGRAAGVALWPERWPCGKLLKNKGVLGDYEFAALYQQRPYIKGGAIFKDTVLRYEKSEIEGRSITIALDTAASKKQSADPSAFVVMATAGEGAEAEADVLEVRRGKWNLFELTAIALELQERYGADIHVERTSQSLPIITYMRNQGVRLVEVAPEGDKFTRAQPFAAAWNNGRVRIPVQAPWLNEYLAELTAFTGTDSDAHDDQVDASAYAWSASQRFSNQLFVV